MVQTTFLKTIWSKLSSRRANASAMEMNKHRYTAEEGRDISVNDLVEIIRNEFSKAEKQLYKLRAQRCSIEEMCRILDTDPDTLRVQSLHLYEKLISAGVISLRCTQKPGR